MPTFVQGNMWDIYPTTNMFVFTTNASFTKDGELVMGAGIAKEVKKKWPGIEKKLGEQLKGYNIYGFRPSPNYPASKLGVFQTKVYWQDDAILSLIETSTNQLHDWVLWEGPERVDLNFPGIGHGKLEEKDVLPIISSLPSCVHIWRR